MRVHSCVEPAPPAAFHCYVCHLRVPARGEFFKTHADCPCDQYNGRTLWFCVECPHPDDAVRYVDGRIAGRRGATFDDAERDARGRPLRDDEP